MARIRTKMTSRERLILHQLQISKWYEEANEEEQEHTLAKNATAADFSLQTEKWRLTEGVTLYAWQQDCMDAWFNNSCKGTVKVVTGAGKTMLALALIERLQGTQNSELCVAIVVPTIVLMHQWYDELIAHGNIPKEQIGRLGGGYKEDFSGGRRILIAVLVSASDKLSNVVAEGHVADNLLLVVDECHRAGATERKSVLNISRRYSLGLSATPERDIDAIGDSNKAYNDSDVGQALGRIIYELSYVRALELGIIPPFSIYHYGLPLSETEQRRYDKLSRTITDLKTELKHQAPPTVKTEGDFWRWVRSIAGKEGSASGAAGKLQGDVKRRKDLLFRMDARFEALKQILLAEYAANKDAQILLFHESIQDAMDIYFRLKQSKFEVIVEHSNLPSAIREDGLDLFRKGDAKILVSVKSLIEGFNVPAVDMGIIVASASSPRQRIQSMGRVMRKHRNNEGEEQTSRICILYAANTVDEAIYGRLNWEAILGADSNKYYKWSPGNEPEEQNGPPDQPKPTEEQIDVEALGLEAGNIYPGVYQGDEFSCDSQRNITNIEGDLAVNPGDIVEKLLQYRGPGRFRITPVRHYVLIRVPLVESTGNEEWVTRYICRLAEPLSFEPRSSDYDTGLDMDMWLASAKPGDAYPFISKEMKQYKFSQKRGGKICKKVKGGDVYAKTAARAEKREKGLDAERILVAMRELDKRHIKITNIEINEFNHVIFKMGGTYMYICALNCGLEFPA